MHESGRGFFIGQLGRKRIVRIVQKGMLENIKSIENIKMYKNILS